jgi:D-aminopeptidase
MADNMESLSGVTAQSMAHELESHRSEFRLDNTVAGLANVPLLMLTSDDGLAPDMDALVAAIRAKGGTSVTVEHVATDHLWDDHRIALESIIINWLAQV